MQTCYVVANMWLIVSSTGCQPVCLLKVAIKLNPQVRHPLSHTPSSHTLRVLSPSHELRQVAQTAMSCEMASIRPPFTDIQPLSLCQEMASIRPPFADNLNVASHAFSASKQ